MSPIEVLHVPDGHLLLQTLRSHDQFNTTIYGLSDRYRGIEGGRRVVFAHREDIAALGHEPGDHIDLVTHWDGDEHVRCARDFRLVAYDVPRGTVAAYYPRDEPAGPARPHRAEEQPARVEVRDRAAHAPRRARLRPRGLAGVGRPRQRPQVPPPQGPAPVVTGTARAVVATRGRPG